MGLIPNDDGFDGPRLRTSATFTSVPRPHRPEQTGQVWLIRRALYYGCELFVLPDGFADEESARLMGEAVLCGHMAIAFADPDTPINGFIRVADEPSGAVFRCLG